MLNPRKRKRLLRHFGEPCSAAKKSKPEDDVWDDDEEDVPNLGENPSLRPTDQPLQTAT